jgi:hypothetical protein
VRTTGELRSDREVGTGWLAVAGAASLGAGAIHAAAIGVHSEHRQAVWAFTLVAVFQIGVGVRALVRPSRWIAVVLAIGSAVLIGGWFLAKTGGIGFIDGLDQSEEVQFADGAAALLATIALFGAGAAAARLRSIGIPGARVVGACALVVTLLTVPAMLAAGSHTHAGGHSHDASDGHSDFQAVVAPEPYDPTKPVDLGGVPGVSAAQRARAEAFVERSIAKLPQFADESTLNAKGYYSIGDALTGDEHYVNWSYLNDDRILDPDFPESLVFRVTSEGKKLAAAMYMLPTGTTLDEVPDVGGPLTQWHVHSDLCLTADPVKPVLAFGSGNFIVRAAEECTPPNTKRADVPMIHVWIIPHPCGPFAALEGVGGGQIKQGEERLCDHAHGSSA